MDGSLRRRGCDMDIPWRPVAATPRLQHGYLVETGARLRYRKGRTSQRGEKASKLVDALKTAKSRGDWCRAAAALDAADGAADWRARGGVGEKLLDSKRLAAAADRLTAIPGAAGGVHGAMYSRPRGYFSGESRRRRGRDVGSSVETRRRDAKI